MVRIPHARRLVIPLTLSVSTLGSACSGEGGKDAGHGSSSSSSGGTSSSSSGGLADAGPFDAGCQPFELYDTITGMCVPLA